MREVKFRGKRVGGNSWVYGYLYKHNSVNPIHQTCVIFDDAGRDIPFSGKYDVIPETVGQFTGLKSKNGKEIYEGDILELKFHNAYIERISWRGKPDAIGVVFWGYQGFRLRCKGEDDSRYANFTDVSLKHSKIIGNIYENSELLEVKD